MKKIMFNDKFLLTQAVLEGRKTQTRRICKEQIWAHSDIVSAENGIYHFESPKYKVGEVVAVAQSYKKCLAENPYNRAYFLNGSAGWNNKMFVAADMMSHQIRITDVRIERLQDISDEDCLKEGIEVFSTRSTASGKAYTFHGVNESYKTPREAYASLIDAVSGKGTWDSNPYVFVYDFKLVK